MVNIQARIDNTKKQIKNTKSLISKAKSTRSKNQLTNLLNNDKANLITFEQSLVRVTGRYNTELALLGNQSVTTVKAFSDLVKALN